MKNYDIATMPGWKYLLLLVVLSIFPLLLQFNAQLDYLDDNCHYLNLAKALYTGRGYVQIHLPGNMPENLVSPGLPAIFAALMAIRDNPKDLIVFKTFFHLCYLLFLILAAHIFTKHLKMNRWIVVGIILFIALNPRVTQFASIETTEMPFMIASAAAILCFLKYAENFKNRYFWLATAFSIATVYIRIPAIPFVIACFIWLLTVKKFDKAFLYGFVVAGVLGFWLVPTALGTGWEYRAQFAPGAETGLSQIAFLWFNFKIHVLEYLFISLPDLIFPATWNIVFTFSPTKWGYFFGSIPLLFMLIGSYGVINDKKPRLVALFVFVYFGIYTFLSSCHERYITVLIMGIVYLIALGVWQILKLIRLRGILLKAIIAILILVPIGFLYQPLLLRAKFVSYTRSRFLNKDTGKYVSRTFAYRYAQEMEVAEYYEALNWCHENLPASTVIMTAQVRSAYYLTDMVCVSPSYYGIARKMMSTGIKTPEDRRDNYDKFMEFALENHVTYIIIDPIFNESIGMIAPSMAKYEGCCSLTYKTINHKTFVFHLDTTCLRQALLSKFDDEKLLNIARLRYANEEKGFPKKFNEYIRSRKENDLNYMRIIEACTKADSITFAEALKNYPHSEEDLESIIKHFDYLRMAGDFPKMESLMSAADTLYPRNAKLWFEWGVAINRVIAEGTVNQKAEQLYWALVAFSRAIRYGADTSDVKNNAGVAYYKVGDYEKAVASFIKAVELDHKNPAKFKNLIAALVSAGKKDEAIELLDLAEKRTDFGEEYVKTAKEMRRLIDMQGKF